MCANPYQTPEDMHVLRETHKYIFFGPSKKDLKNTYFQAVYLFEKKLRIQAGQRVVLTHNSKEEYGVALVGQAQNRQVWVWLVSFQTEDVVKRLIVQVSAITGQQTPEEQEICRNSLSRYQRKSSSYAAYAAVTSSPSSTSENSSPNRTPLSTRRLRSQALKTDRELRPKRKPKFNRRSADDSENSEDDDFYYSSSPSFSNSATNSPIISARELHEAADKKDHRLEHGELFMTLLECVVMTLAKEYPQSDEMND
jgi:hypothetical protein